MDAISAGNASAEVLKQTKDYPCNLETSQKGNGIGCSWYALHDICPDDETKGYWECLPK